VGSPPQQRLDAIERHRLGHEARGVRGDRRVDGERVVGEPEPTGLAVGLLEQRDAALELAELDERVAAQIGAEHRRVQERRLVRGRQRAQRVARGPGEAAGEVTLAGEALEHQRANPRVGVVAVAKARRHQQRRGAIEVARARQRQAEEEAPGGKRARIGRGGARAPGVEPRARLVHAIDERQRADHERHVGARRLVARVVERHDLGVEPGVEPPREVGVADRGLAACGGASCSFQ
jgi:hypothetical protein